MREWARRQLGQLVAFQKGRKVEVSDHPREGFEPYLGAALISGGEGEHADTRGAVMATPADVLMLWDGERSGLVGKGRQGVVSSTVARLTPSAEVDGTFLYYALDFKFDWIQGRRTGTGVPHVPKDLGRILCIDYPTETRERSRIAEILSTLDEAIEQTEGLIAKTQAIKAGLMHDLFTRGVTANGELRPPREESPHLYKASPLGWIPKEWTISQIRELSSVVTSGSRGWAAYYAPDGSLFVRSQNVRAGHLDFSDRQYVVPPAGSEGQRTDLSRCDLLVTITGNSVGNIACVPADWTDSAFVSQHVGLIRLKEPEQAQFTMNFLSPGAPGNQQIVEAQYGQSKPGLNLENLRNLRIPVTSATERELIVERLKTIQANTEHEVQHLEKLRLYRDGLMHDLLTGRVPVPLPEPQALAADA